MSHFTVVLPSDASMDCFPDNAVAHFKTKLAYPICTDGDYEVALMELIYPNNFNNFFLKEPLVVAYPLESPSERQRVSDEYADVEHDTRVSFRNQFQWKLESGYYKNEQALVKYINAELLKKYKTVYDGEFDKPFLEFNEKTRLMSFSVTGNVGLKPTDQRYARYNERSQIRLIPAAAGLSEEFIKRFGLQDFGVRKPFRIGGGVRLMYMYSDIITPYLVGNVQVPLLRTVAPSGERGEMITVTFNNPYYIPVARRGIDTIQIHINNEIGKPMPFTGGKSLVVLHFRRRNESLLSDSTK
jgi:hypothetical protein